MRVTFTEELQQLEASLHEEGDLEDPRVEVEPRKLAVEEACLPLDCFSSHQVAYPLARGPPAWVTNLGRSG